MITYQFNFRSTDTMTDELSNVNRRNFLKNAGVILGGSALGAAGVTLRPEITQAAEAVKGIPKTISQFRCPVCGSNFSTFGELKAHFKTDHPEHVMPVTTKLKVNEEECEVLIEPNWTLQQTLQYKLGLTGAKHMCGRGACGSCTVIMDGRPILSCMTLAVECEGKEIQTIEGIAADPKWRPLIDSYCKWDAMQCGYCTPGMLVSAKSLLDRNNSPTEQECKEALSGNICCCGTYHRHPTAILEAVPAIKGGA